MDSDRKTNKPGMYIFILFIFFTEFTGHQLPLRKWLSCLLRFTVPCVYNFYLLQVSFIYDYVHFFPFLIVSYVIINVLTFFVWLGVVSSHFLTISLDACKGLQC